MSSSTSGGGGGAPSSPSSSTPPSVRGRRRAASGPRNYTGEVNLDLDLDLDTKLALAASLGVGVESTSSSARRSGLTRADLASAIKSEESASAPAAAAAAASSAAASAEPAAATGARKRLSSVSKPKSTPSKVRLPSLGSSAAAAFADLPADLALRTPPRATKTKAAKSTSKSAPKSGPKSAPKSAPKSTPKSSSASGTSAPCRGRTSYCEEPTPVFDEDKARQSLYLFSSTLTLDELPPAYKDSSFVEVVDHVKIHMKTFGLNQVRLSEEMCCSGSTVYFLLADKPKHENTVYDVRMRHYLWRTDQWFVGRARQHARLQSEAAKADQMDVDEEAKQPPIAGSDDDTPLPRPLDLPASVSDADWLAWSELSMPKLQDRTAIDSLVHPHLQALELALATPHLYRDDKARADAKAEKAEAKARRKVGAAGSDDEAGVTASGRPARRTAKRKASLREEESDASDASESGAPRRRSAKKKKKKEAKDDDSSASHSSSESENDSGSDSATSLDSNPSDKPRRGKGGGIARRMRKLEEFDITDTCRYPNSMPTRTRARHSAPFAHALLQDALWRFTDEVAIARDATAEEVARVHLGRELKEVEFTSNGRRIKLAPFAATATSSTQRTSARTTRLKVEPAASAKKSDDSDDEEEGGEEAEEPIDLDAFINVGLPVSTMAWCPLGDAAHSPMRSPQYLAVAVDHTEAFVRISSPPSTAGLLMVYAVTVNSPIAPQAVLSLTHSHGTCTALAWYPHACETFEPLGSTQIDRIGILAAIFADGTVQVRAIPRPSADDTETSGCVQQASLSSLPGVTLCFPSASPSTVLATPTSICWSLEAQTAMLAVGYSHGRVAVYDLVWSRTQEAKKPTHVIACGNTIVSGVCFHPSCSHLLSLCTFAGDTAVYDLRAPSTPIFRIATQVEPCRSIVWPRVAHSIQEFLLIAQTNEVRIVALSTHTQIMSADKATCKMEFLPSRQLPVGDHAVVIQLAAAPRERLEDPVVLATANSDGTCYAIAANTDRVSIGAAVTAGLLRTQWNDDDRKAEEQPPTAASDADRRKILDISDSYPAEKGLSRDRLIAQRKHRFSSEQMTRYAATATPQQMATDQTTEMHASDMED